MNKKQYLEKRNKLMNEAQALIDEGKAEEAQAKMDEVKKLDEKWDAIAQAQANLTALNTEPTGLAGFGAGFSMGENDGAENIENMSSSEVYKNAWAKMLMNVPLSDEERRCYSMVNEAYTHSTKNTGIVIPETVARGIWELVGEMYPYFNDVTKTYVNGTLTMLMDDTSSDAKWYDEDTKTEDGKETFKKLTLSGCELSRSITVTWKLKEMAIEDFIPYIQRRMAKKMGAAAGYGATHGAGASAVSGKPEPMGVVTALEAEDGTPQIVTYAKGSTPTYKDITATRAKIKAGYGTRLAVYANSSTIWNVIANILDGNKRPMFVPDVVNGGVGRILGMVAKEDDSMKDGEILMSNASDGYTMNINKEATMTPEDHVKDRQTDYCGYAIMDGNITTPKAHALLKEASE